MSSPREGVLDTSPCQKCGGPMRQMACDEFRTCDTCSPHHADKSSCYEMSKDRERFYYDCAPDDVRREWSDD